jgi:hypothetical protein
MLAGGMAARRGKMRGARRRRGAGGRCLARARVQAKGRARRSGQRAQGGRRRHSVGRAAASWPACDAQAPLQQPLSSALLTTKRQPQSPAAQTPRHAQTTARSVKGRCAEARRRGRLPASLQLRCARRGHAFALGRMALLLRYPRPAQAQRARRARRRLRPRRPARRAVGEPLAVQGQRLLRSAALRAACGGRASEADAPPCAASSCAGAPMQGRRRAALQSCPKGR